VERRPVDHGYDDAYSVALEDGWSLRSAWPVDDAHVMAALIDTADAPAPKSM